MRARSRSSAPRPADAPPTRAGATCQLAGDFHASFSLKMGARGAAMQLKKLGRSDLMVSPLCLGGNVFGWTVDEAQSFALLDEFVGAGFNFVDTADVYSAW